MVSIVTKSDPGSMVSVDDKSEGSEDVAIDGKILCWYESWDHVIED